MTRGIRPLHKPRRINTPRTPECDTPCTRARHARRKNEESAEEGVLALDEQAVQGLLDGLAHLVGEVEDQHRIIGGTGFVGVGAHRLTELDVPFGRQTAPSPADLTAGTAGSPGNTVCRATEPAA